MCGEGGGGGGDVERGEMFDDMCMLILPVFMSVAFNLIMKCTHLGLI